jgi:hypothetical protein
MRGHDTVLDPHTVGGHIKRYNFSHHARIFPLRIMTTGGSDADRCGEG